MHLLRPYRLSFDLLSAHLYSEAHVTPRNKLMHFCAFTQKSLCCRFRQGMYECRTMVGWPALLLCSARACLLCFDSGR